MIPSTNIKSTRENREIVKFLENYKAAVEKLSVDAVMELAAKDFHDNVGSEDPAKHLDYLGLKEKLEKYFPRIKKIFLGMFVQHVAKIEKDKYEVVAYFNKEFEAEVPAGDKWFSIKEVVRFVIRKTTGNAKYPYEILSGI